MLVLICLCCQNHFLVQYDSYSHIENNNCAMAGRGCIIHIKVLNTGATEGGEESSTDLPLQVALHSPLEILRDEIERLTNIEKRDQVLILCDFTDPERNSDVLLDSERDSFSLRDCGIRNNSILTLHALGISAERRMRLMEEAFSKKKKESETSKIPLNVISTRITPAAANHSYNGIIFDIEVKTPHIISIDSISIGGMLGPVVRYQHCFCFQIYLSCILIWNIYDKMYFYFPFPL